MWDGCTLPTSETIFAPLAIYLFGYEHNSIFVKNTNLSKKQNRDKVNE